MTNNYLSGKEIKEYLLDPREYIMCHYCNFAIKHDGYCPQYDCWATDTFRRLSDRQWDDIARKLKFTDVDSIDIIDVWEEIKKKRIRMKGD